MYDLLDPDKTYLIGTPMDDRPIFAKAREYCSALPDGSEAWLHVGAMFYANHAWRILDCQGWKGGVILFTLAEALLEYYGKIDAWAVEYPHWDLPALHTWLGTPCNPKKLFRYGRLTKRSVPRLDDAAGTTCSEFLALCDGGFISRVSGKSPYDVVPVDFQKYAISSGLEMISMLRKIG